MDEDFGKVIDKPWGFESVVFRNSYYAIWELFIKGGEETSFHFHPGKKTIMLVLTGKVKCCVGDETRILDPQDGVAIEKGIPHSSGSLSPEGSRILEIDCPPLLTDIVRLKDKYGRAGKPYFPNGDKDD